MEVFEPGITRASKTVVRIIPNSCISSHGRTDALLVVCEQGLSMTRIARARASMGVNIALVLLFAVHYLHQVLSGLDLRIERVCDTILFSSISVDT